MPKPAEKPELSLLTVISELENEGKLFPLIRAGVVSANLLLYRDIYKFVDAQRKAGASMLEIIVEVEARYKIRQSRIYEVIKMFKN